MLRSISIVVRLDFGIIFISFWIIVLIKLIFFVNFMFVIVIKVILRVWKFIKFEMIEVNIKWIFLLFNKFFICVVVSFSVFVLVLIVLNVMCWFIR